MNAQNPKALALEFGDVISKKLFETRNNIKRMNTLLRGTVWVSMQADDVTGRDYWLARSKQTGVRIGKIWAKISFFIIAVCGGVPGDVIRPKLLLSLGRAKIAGCPYATLSNEFVLFCRPGFRLKLSFLPQIDVIDNATDTETLNSAPAAYESLIVVLGVATQNCVFVGNQLCDIDGESAIGMTSVNFDVMNPKPSFAKAERLLGLA